MRKPFVIGSIIVYVLLLVLVAAKLFFEDSFERIVGLFLPQKNTQAQLVRIGVGEPATRLNPLANDIGSRARLLHIFEPLIRTNGDLQLEPALAISYGALDETHFEFRMRPEVYFHNSTLLTLDDVVSSLQAARTNPQSQLKDYLSTVTSIEKNGDDTFTITTSSADPLLPAKLSFVPIFPASMAEDELIGTGPYRFVKSDTNTISLERFENYWDDIPYYKDVTITTLTTKAEKLAALKNKTVDILASLPADVASEFYQPGYALKTRPSLEVNFLLFNPNGVLADISLRKALVALIDRALLSRFGHGFAQPASQFAPDGIFGYSPLLKVAPRNVAKAKELVGMYRLAQSGFPQSGKISADLLMPVGLESVGKTIQKLVAEANIDLKVEYVPQNVYGERVKTNALYFFGWRFDLGDTGDFVSAVVHSPSATLGQYSPGFQNAELDELIEKSQRTLAPKERLKILREIMEIITDKDPIGVPLFTPELLYAVADGVSWLPRVDGYILARDAKK